MDIQITTNGTIEGTKLIVDGNEISTLDKIVNIEFCANAPYKSQYSGDMIRGSVVATYRKANDDGTIEQNSLISGDTSANIGIGQKIKQKDQVIRYVGQDVDAKVVDLVNRIINHCTATNIKVQDKTTLLNRTTESLKDKCLDLGIKLED